jgi:hypothetical protein
MACAVAVLALGGCTPTTRDASPTAVTITVETSAPPTPAASEIAAMELEASASLAGGRYTRSAFQPRITFEVADQQWAAVQLFSGFFDIQQAEGTPDVIAVQFTTTDAVYGANLAVVPVTTAAEALEGLQANPTLRVVETSTATIGGLTAQRITVDTAGDQEARIFHTPPGALSMDPLRRIRIFLIDQPDGRVLAILLGGSVKEWAKAEASAQPVLDSITIGR